MPETPNVSSESYQINLNNFGYCTVTANTTSSYAVGTKKTLAGIREATFTPVFASGKVYGDGVVKKNVSRLTGATIKINMNKIPIEDRATLCGYTYTNGVLRATAGATPPKIAIYYEMPADDGTKEQIWFFVGEVQPFGKTAKQTEENISFGSDELTIECTARNLDNAVYELADTANADFTSTASETFATAPSTT